MVTYMHTIRYVQNLHVPTGTYHQLLINFSNEHIIIPTCNSRYRIHTIWPRDGACHANHAYAALAISRSCRQALVFFHWKCTHVSQKSLSLIIKHIHVLKDTIMIYWDICLHFQNLSVLCHPIQKLGIVALILFISCSISIRTGNELVNNCHAL